MIVVDVQQPLWMLSGMVMPSRITKQPLGYCKIFPKPSFVCVFLVPLKNFSLMWRCHRIQCEGCKFWPIGILGTYDHLACHTYCDTGHPFIMVILEDTWHTHSAKHFPRELSLPALMKWVFLGWDSNTQPSACGVDALTHCATSAAKTTRRNTNGYVIDALYSAWYTSGVPLLPTTL